MCALKRHADVCKQILHAIDTKEQIDLSCGYGCFVDSVICERGNYLAINVSEWVGHENRQYIYIAYTSDCVGNIGGTFLYSIFAVLIFRQC